MSWICRIAIVLFSIGLSTPVVAEPFRAAAVKVDITPETSQWLLGYEPRQSQSVHDRIYHRIVAMAGGGTTFVLVSSDLCAISPDVYDAFCGRLENETGISRKQFWWAVTHTHSAPEVGPFALGKVFLKERFRHEWDRTYAEKTQKLLIQGIKEAVAGLEPARLAIGSGMSMANMNRRARHPDGKVLLGLNPDGPVDRQIGLLRLERPDGSVIALIANYAMHGTVLGAVKQISGDAPGSVAGYVEAKLGAPMLYVNGAAGNIHPIYFFNGGFRNLPLFQVILGDRILAANSSIRAAGDEAPTLRLEELTVETAQRPDIAWPEELADYQRVTDKGEKMLRIPVRFLRIGNDTVLWSAPLELFCEIAIRVRNASPLPNTYYFGYTNGWLGYLPTGPAFQEGGYEPDVSPFTTQAEEDFSQTVIKHLHGMSR